MISEDERVVLPPLLGVVDAQIESDEDEALHWTTNKFGGIPNWLSAIAVEYPSCAICCEPLYLVVQVYAPLQGSRFHRTIHVFACARPSCLNRPESWKVLRSELLDKDYDIEKAPVPVADEWEVGAWGDDDLESAICHSAQAANSPSLLAGTLSSKLSLGERASSHVASASRKMPRFVPHYMAVLEETDRGLPDFEYEEALLDEYRKRTGEDLIRGTGERDSNVKLMDAEEKYEKTRHMDRAFHLFSKEIRNCPHQCLRYRWMGKPLLFSESQPLSCDFSSVPNCSCCGSERVFEMQLMPGLVSHLRVNGECAETGARDLVPRRLSEDMASDESGDTAMRHRTPSDAFCLQSGDTGFEFGCVYVFSCSQSCWPDVEGYTVPKEEFAIVQSDPDARMFKQDV